MRGKEQIKAMKQNSYISGEALKANRGVCLATWRSGKGT
jgi:hypothetical protein